MVRILLGDDHTIVRQGLRKVLEEHDGWDVVGEAPDGREAVRLALTLDPDAAVLDIGMPLLTGIEATRQILRRLPTVGVLILSIFGRGVHHVSASSRRARLPDEGFG